MREDVLLEHVAGHLRVNLAIIRRIVGQEPRDCHAKRKRQQEENDKDNNSAWFVLRLIDPLFVVLFLHQTKLKLEL
jgi:hypothetical protein